MEEKDQIQEKLNRLIKNLRTCIVSKLSLEPGDTILIYNRKRTISHEESRNVTSVMKSLFPANTTIFMADYDLKVVKEKEVKKDTIKKTRKK